MHVSVEYRSELFFVVFGSIVKNIFYKQRNNNNYVTNYFKEYFIQGTALIGIKKKNQIDHIYVNTVDFF